MKNSGATNASQHSSLVIQRVWRDCQTQKNLEIFAIVDAARRSYIFPEIEGCGLEFGCLLEGHLPPDLEQVAPYLVRLQPGAPFTRWLFDEGRGDNWGIVLAAPAKLEHLLAHFRGMLMAATPDGNAYFFRFFDPRVLRVFLPACDDRQLDQFFGHVKTVFCDSEDGKELLVYGRKGAKLVEEKIPTA